MPTQFWSFMELGDLLAASGKSDEAATLFEKAVEFVPNEAGALNGLAWQLARLPGSKLESYTTAVKLAQRAVELAPTAGHIWNTLGVAQYRVGDWKAAIVALEKSMELSSGMNEGFNTFFLAMAQWQLSQKDESRKRYDEAVAWADKKLPQSEELNRFRIEAEELLGVKPRPAPETEPKSPK